MATAWLVMAVGDDRSHGGNDGYDDDPARHYSWDSTVPNSERPAVGDVIALWDKKSLLGVSVIEDIETGRAEKDRYTCPLPGCGKADFKPRKKKRPVYRCNECYGEFDVPNARREEVTTFRTRHATAWVDMAGALPGSVLRQLCDKPSQHSIRAMRWERLQTALAGVGVTASVTIAEQARRTITGGHRERVVRARVGQAEFRARLLERHGPVCAFTGPAPATVLEAAHLYSYAANGAHHDDGGLLLRRDVHRLFDLGHIAVDPATQALDVLPALAAYPAYAALHGTAPAVPLQRSRAWLEAHWAQHRSH
ncbi:HNH endonuclease signature motif containing protein [Kitasatospora purpeofusca]|uniref:HNH endonuclease signature motif containing protein n=1 Tax=Kitasatospora purpeofusca TaxID=67352 RepID=UPI0033C2A383